jgi:hypothetical protein
MRNLFATSARAVALAAVAALPVAPSRAAGPDLSDVRREVEKRHDAAVQALKDWIALPSIAAENLNFPAGAEHMAKLAREAGFTRVEVVQTSGKPGVFATLDAGAKTTVGLYFMYDVKQYDPAEWSSPPLEGRLVDRPGVGKVSWGGARSTRRDPRWRPSPPSRPCGPPAGRCP